MGDLVKINQCNEKEVIRKQNDVLEITEEMLLDVHANLSSEKTMSIPITELATLGAGVSSLVPALNTVTQTTTVSTSGLYRLANAGVGDTLKVAKNGNFWGVIKTSEGGSKLAQLQEAGPLSTTNTTAMPINPATMMMAVALFSIEQQIGTIAEMEKQIIFFKQSEKESEIEADVETLMNIITKYKDNWDNEHFIASNHKMVLDIQRIARKNMLFYQKQIAEVQESKQFIVTHKKVKSTLNEMTKMFKYYRLSLYAYSMASLVEIMLSGNFKEENISITKEEIEKYSMEYRGLFAKCSSSLEKMSGSLLETNLMKGVGNVGKAVGEMIGSIPAVKEGPVDEFLQDSGSHFKENAQEAELEAVKVFAQLGNPGTGVFTEEIEDLIRIYNHTSEIYFDDEKIYLVAG